MIFIYLFILFVLYYIFLYRDTISIYKDIDKLKN